MKKSHTQLDIVWEQQATPEARERLLAAFEMLFKDVVIDFPQDEPI
jgi:hypothetical protein